MAENLLHSAIRNSDVDTLKYLLDQGGNINAIDKLGRTLLHCAVIKLHIDISKVLDHKTNMSEKCHDTRKMPLHYVSSESLSDSVRLLLERGANVNAFDVLDQTPLFYAVMHPYSDIVKLLLYHGANVNAVDKFGRTPLHHAALASYVDIVKLLLEHGANVNVFDRLHQTPLHNAVRGSCVDIVKFLLERGANVNCLNYLGQSPLLNSFVVDKPNVSVIKALINYGANVNITDQHGEYVLFTAIRNPSTTYEIIQLLLENGADPKFDEEKNILACIAQPKRYHLAELLMQYIIIKKSGSPGAIQDLDEFKSVLSAHIAEDSDNYKHFLRFAYFCISEIKKMKNDFVSDDQTLFQFVSENCSRTTVIDQNVTVCVTDALLLLLKSGKYVECRDLIYTSIKRSLIVDRLCELVICYQVSDGYAVTLNFACIDSVTEYMSKGDMINMIILFCDKFSVHV